MGHGFNNVYGVGHGLVLVSVLEGIQAWSFIRCLVECSRSASFSCSSLVQAIEGLEAAIDALREKREGLKKEMDDQVQQL